MKQMTAQCWLEKDKDSERHWGDVSVNNGIIERKRMASFTLPSFTLLLLTQTMAV